MLIPVEVTQEHIDKAIENHKNHIIDCKSCVVAIALSDKFKAVVRVGYFSASYDDMNVHHSFILEASAMNLVNEFDNPKTQHLIKPQTIEIRSK